MTLFLLSIWCVFREFIDLVDYICWLLLNIDWWFQGLQWLCFRCRLWISGDIPFLAIPCVDHDSIFAIDFMHRSWIHWRCQLHTSAVTRYSLTISRFTMTLFSLPIMDHQWHNILDDSMSRPWLYFFYRFYVSFMNSLTLLIPYSSCHSIFIDDFKVYSDSVLAGDLWISRDIAFWQFHTSAMTLFFLSIRCVVREFI